MSDVMMTRDATPIVVREDSLLVTWQQPATRSYFLMGALRQIDEERFSFSYYPGVEKQPGFRALPGFPDTTKTYESGVLFPLFSSRVMSVKRPDRAEWLGSMGLEKEAEPFEILGRSLGLRVADTIELYPEPTVDLARKTVTAVVPIHGLRYHDEGMKLVGKDVLSRGDILTVEPEPENSHDHRALAVRTVDGVKLGYIPSPILDYLDRGGHVHDAAVAHVAHVNPHQYGHHQRLILSVVWNV